MRPAVTILCWLLLLATALAAPCEVSAQRRARKAKTAIEEAGTTGNILWNKQVTRHLRLSAPPNAGLLQLTDTAGNTTSLNALIARALASHELRAYNQPGGDTAVVTHNMLRSLHDTVTVKGFIIIETWAFHKDVGQMIVTIQHIGPCDNRVAAMLDTLSNRNGTSLSARCSDSLLQPLFYIDFAELAPMLLHYTLPAGKKEKQLSCSSFFDSRKFSSLIICIKDPMNPGREVRVEEDGWVY